MPKKTIRLRTAILVTAGVLAAAAGFAWLFLRRRTIVEHTVSVGDDVEIRYK